LGDRGLLDVDIRGRARRGQLGQVGLGLRQAGAGLIDAGLLLGDIGFARVLERSQLGLGVGQFGLGLLDVVGLGLKSVVIRHLGLLDARLGTVQRGLGLDVGIVVLLALGVVQFVLDLLAIRAGGGRFGRVGAGLLDILPVLLGRGVLRLGLCERVARL